MQRPTDVRFLRLVGFLTIAFVTVDLYLFELVGATKPTDERAASRCNQRGPVLPSLAAGLGISGKPCLALGAPGQVNQRSAALGDNLACSPGISASPHSPCNQAEPQIYHTWL
jgi:hypothetical protein